MCLQLYSKVTQYMPQVLTPPSKAHTDRLFAAFDLDDSGRLERAEWQLLASVLPLTLTLALALALALTLTLNPNPNPGPNPNPPRPAGSRCLHRSRTNPHSLPDTGIDMMNLI